MNFNKKSVLYLLIVSFCLFLIPTCSAEEVFYNAKSKKYHNFNCRYVQKCTVNCIKIEKKDAKRRGGIPCKVCGG